MRGVVMDDGAVLAEAVGRERVADLPLVLEDLLAQIEDARAWGRPDADLVAEYVWLRERA